MLALPLPIDFENSSKKGIHMMSCILLSDGVALNLLLPPPGTDGCFGGVDDSQIEYKRSGVDIFYG